MAELTSRSGRRRPRIPRRPEPEAAASVSARRVPAGAPGSCARCLGNGPGSCARCRGNGSGGDGGGGGDAVMDLEEAVSEPGALRARRRGGRG